MGQIYINDEVHDKLRIINAKNHVPIKALVEKALDKYFQLDEIAGYIQEDKIK